MATTFKERAPWPIWLWGFLLFLAISLAVAFWAALGNTWGAMSMLVQLLLLLYASQATLLEVRVDEEKFYVGHASIDKTFITAVTPLDSQAMAQVRGPRANPYAFLAIRFWISTGVKIDIKDPEDPTPYWLVSGKRFKELAAALKN